jgi:transcriptional regulator with XRE-family HTH domain
MAFLLMTEINARNVNGVNAYIANAVPQYSAVGKQTESPPSAFWVRLTDAWKPRGLPTSQNGVATKLEMSQGSTRRWYTGEGYPEIEVLRKIAELGKVTVDWLLNETLPKSPIGQNTPLGRLMVVWEQLDDDGKEHTYRAALGQLAMKAPSLDSVKKTWKEQSGKP